MEMITIGEWSNIINLWYLSFQLKSMIPIQNRLLRSLVIIL